MFATGKRENPKKRGDAAFFEDLCCKFRGTMLVGRVFLSWIPVPILAKSIPTMVTIHYLNYRYRNLNIKISSESVRRKLCDSIIEETTRTTREQCPFGGQRFFRGFHMFRWGKNSGRLGIRI
jgi:hypothetical protein